MFEGSSLFTAGVCLVSFMKNVFSLAIYINTKQGSNLNSLFHSQEWNSGKIYLQKVQIYPSSQERLPLCFPIIHGEIWHLSLNLSVGFFDFADISLFVMVYGLLKLEINSFASNIFLKNISYRYGLICEEIMYGQCWSEINFTLIYVKCNKVFVLYY